jgi:putative colanic acid biosynthesis acetyltransferase WcaF
MAPALLPLVCMTRDLIPNKTRFEGPTFTLANRARRACWQVTWALTSRWTPPPLHRWRIFWLNAFGAKVSYRARIYGTASVWAPWLLEVDDQAIVGPGVTLYNMARVRIGPQAVVSQGAHVCAGTHDHRQPSFPLYARAIDIGRRAWVCSGAFVGPGAHVGEGAVLAACGVTFDPLKPWTVYWGNPAQEKGPRPYIPEGFD